MNDERQFATAPLPEALPELLKARGMNLSGLAREVGVSHSHLSRAVRGRDHKTLSADLFLRINDALGVPAGYFAEERELAVIDRVRNDGALRDELYRRLRPPSDG